MYTPSPLAQAASAAASQGLGSLAEFLAPDEGPELAAGSSSSSADAATAADAHWQDLGCLMPELAVTAQQLQLQLLQLLQQHDYSCDALQEQLLAELAKAESYYAAHVAGTPLDTWLAVKAAGSSSSSSAGGGDEEAGAAAGEASEGSEAAAAADAQPAAALDFGVLRGHIEALVAGMRPLLDVGGVAAERQAAQLAARLRQLLLELEPLARAGAGASNAADGGDEAAGASNAAASSSGSAAAADAEAQPLLEQLRAACAGAPAEALVRAFNQLEFPQRRLLLQLAPAARAQLNVRGVDLRCVARRLLACVWGGGVCCILPVMAACHMAPCSRPSATACALAAACRVF